MEDRNEAKQRESLAMDCFEDHRFSWLDPLLFLVKKNEIPFCCCRSPTKISLVTLG